MWAKENDDKNPPTFEMKEVQLLTSVCTGALVLVKEGLLKGKMATTHWASIERLETEFPEVKYNGELNWLMKET